MSAVDDYLAALPPDQRAALEHLRATIRAAAPDATEAISYGMPAFKQDGRGLVGYAAFKAHCSLFPMSSHGHRRAGGRARGIHDLEGHDPLHAPARRCPTRWSRGSSQARLAELAARG